MERQWFIFYKSLQIFVWSMKTDPAFHSEGLIPSSLQRGYPLEWELWRDEGCMGTKQLFLEVPFCVFILWPHGGAVIMQRICAKAHGCSKCPSFFPFKIFHSEGPFEVVSFEHFGLERPFNVAAMIVFTPKCPSEGDYIPFGTHRQYTP